MELNQKTEKYLENAFKLKNTLLNDPQVREEIAKKIRKYFGLGENNSK